MNLGITEEPRTAFARSLSRTPHQRIFVVEDDDMTRENLVDELALQGHEIVGVQNGAQLLECLRIIAYDHLRVPDLIVMDVRMPGRSGIDLLETLRRAEWRTPVVLMTSFVSDELRFRAEVAGAAEVLQKPFALDHLRVAARRAGAKKDSFMPCERNWFRRFAS